jgi:hypothetical protein
MLNTSELAKENNLSRQTTSVTRDTKRNTLIIVEQVSAGKEGSTRTETYYRVFEDTDTDKVNVLISEAKAAATLEFLGLAQVSDCDEPAEPVEAKEAPGKKPKKAGKKPPAKKQAKKEIEEPEIVPDDDENLFDEVDESPEEEPVKEAVKPVLYDRASRDHTAHLKPLLVKILGKTWKTDKDKYAKVKSLVGQLDGKIAVTDVEGNELPTFKKFVSAYLGQA